MRHRRYKEKQEVAKGKRGEMKKEGRIDRSKRLKWKKSKNLNIKEKDKV